MTIQRSVLFLFRGFPLEFLCSCEGSGPSDKPRTGRSYTRNEMRSTSSPTSAFLLEFRPRGREERLRISFRDRGGFSDIFFYEAFPPWPVFPKILTNYSRCSSFSIWFTKAAISPSTFLICASRSASGRPSSGSSCDAAKRSFSVMTQ